MRHKSHKVIKKLIGFVIIMLNSILYIQYFRIFNFILDEKSSGEYNSFLGI